MSEELLDFKGNEFKEGAIVRVYHFHTKRKIYYMYKQVFKIDNEKQYVHFSHLPIKDKPSDDFRYSKEQLLNHCLIVQCYYADMRELKR